MSCNNTLLCLENVSKRYELYEKPQHRLWQMLLRGRKQFYKEFWAVQNVSFSIQRGETVGILGRNGAGKSTLLQLIAGTLTPTEGTISISGRVAALLELGSGFNPEFTGRENAYLNGAILGLSRVEMDEAMPAIEQFADIGDFFDQPVKIYSSGMMVRVAFAVQVQIKPEFLIVDEALSVGDALFQTRCFKRLHELKASGTTILVVSHDIETIRMLTTQCLLMDQGKLLEKGSTADVILSYQALLAQYDAEAKGINKRIPNLKIFYDKETKAIQSTAVELHNVRLTNGAGQETSTVTLRDPFKIFVTLLPKQDITHLFVGVRIICRNGVKVFSGGTWNQDLVLTRTQSTQERVYDHTFKKDMPETICFDFICKLNANFYEVQIGLAVVEEFELGGAAEIAWCNEAAVFEVPYSRDIAVGAGMVDLDMKASIVPES